MAAFFDWYMGRVSQLTVVRRLGPIKFFYEYVRSLGVREDNPASSIRLKMPKTQAQAPFSHEELRRLLEAAPCLRDRTMLLVLISTGCRLGELAAMSVRDIDWERQVILIHGKGQRQRYVGLSPGTLVALREHVESRVGPVWLGQYEEQMVPMGCYHLLRRLGAAAGVSRTYPHRFRTTFANEFLSAGGDLQSLQVLMGHSKITTTAHYSQWSAAQRALEQQRKFDLADRL